MPFATDRIVFCIRGCVIGQDGQAWLGSEQANPVDPPAVFGDVFFVTPTQSAKEIPLPVEALPVRIISIQRVIA